MRRHIVAYGGISDKYLKEIAEKSNVLIVGKITEAQIKKIKKINPNILIFKYCNAIGINQSHQEWDIIKNHKDWFIYIDNKKLINRKYKWHLMNIANKEWRSYFAEFINRQTPQLFDGIFLDDCWDKFIDKFSDPTSPHPITSDKAGLTEWSEQIILLLEEIKKAYPKKVIINGSFNEYLKIVDGCMMEGFIHSNNKSDSIYPDPSSILRTLNKVMDLQKYDKMLFLQSGSNGDGTADVDRIFRLCVGGYLLVENENTFFNFQPRKGYYYKGTDESYDIYYQLGKADGRFFVESDRLNGNNLLSNGDFNNGLSGWQIKRGKPTLDICSEKESKCVLFQSLGNNGDMITSDYIKVVPDKEYKIYVLCGSEQNTPGSAFYKKFGVTGRFYDASMNVIPGAYDLMVDEGIYDYRPFERNYTSPGSAAYFKISAGFIGDGIGKCRLENIYFGESADQSMILRRNFTSSTVLVDIGTAETTIK